VKNSRRWSDRADSQPKFEILSGFAFSGDLSTLNAIMRSLFLFVTIVLSLPLCVLASPIKAGQTAEQVLEALGKPVGTIELREKTLLLYPQGEVTLRDDLVTEIDLMNEEQFAADQERLRQEREEWLVDQENLRIARKKEGESIRAAKMQSRAFASLPAKDTVDYWRSFQIRYPEVDVSEQIASALAGYETELKELRNQQRIAELEARVAQAEKETAIARLETKKLREETERAERSRNYGLRYYTDPVINNNRHYYRPPTVTIFSNGHGAATTTHQKNGINRYYGKQSQSESVAERVSRILKDVKR